MKRNALLMLLSVISLVGRLSAQPPAKQKAVINHLAVFVVNLQKSVDFYSGVFALDTIPEPFHDNKHAWFSIGPGMALHVIEGATQPKDYYQNNHICFRVPSVEVFLQTVKAKQIPYRNAQGVLGQVTNRVDGVKQIWVNDPDGYWVEVNDAKN